MSSEVSKICFFKFLTALFCCASCTQSDVRAMIKRSPSMYMIDNPADLASAESPPATSNSEEGNPWETEDSSAVPRDSQYFVEEIDNLARFFEIYYDDYYKRIVIDMSYPSLLSNQLKKACSSNNEVLKSNLERVENLGDDWEAAKSLVLAIFSIKSTEKSDCIEGLLKSLWEDKTGRQRLKSFMVLQLIYPDGFFPLKYIDGQVYRGKTIPLYLESPEEYKDHGSAGYFCPDTNSVHLKDDRFTRFYKEDGTLIDAKKQEVEAKERLIITLLHELTHAYHHCFFLYNGRGFKIPRDSIFGKKLFLQETLEGLLVVMKESITAVDEQLNISRDSTQVEELAAKILKEAGLFPENFEWEDREELLTVTGILPVDLILFSLIDGSPKIFKFLITDRQNQSSGERRIFNVERVSYNPPRTFRSEEDSLKRLIAS
ncbi:MAG: hypothetical protein LBJ71_04195, partial [Holosporaceae bacterium]|nr:hypothetical protein [Holosporaceae bacterium]